jgi:hypothetical protein
MDLNIKEKKDEDRKKGKEKWMKGRIECSERIMNCVYGHPQSARGRQTQFCDSELHRQYWQRMTTAYAAVDVMGTSPDSDGTAFNPIPPLNGVLWL